MSLRSMRVIEILPLQLLRFGWFLHFIAVCPPDTHHIFRMIYEPITIPLPAVDHVITRALFIRDGIVEVPLEEGTELAESTRRPLAVSLLSTSSRSGVLDAASPS